MKWVPCSGVLVIHIHPCHWHRHLSSTNSYRKYFVMHGEQWTAQRKKIEIKKPKKPMWSNRYQRLCNSYWSEAGKRLNILNTIFTVNEEKILLFWPNRINKQRWKKKYKRAKNRLIISLNLGNKNCGVVTLTTWTVNRLLNFVVPMPTPLRKLKKKGIYFFFFIGSSFRSVSFLNTKHNTNNRSIFDFPFHFPDSGVYLYSQLTLKLNIEHFVWP